ncbi:uncharacterized protein LOC131213163 [Anopheles bellator]|uniref:uncharacterized protein LOC131213163 n=1 Tax=Anopheles bellator TaxID=139047 RepID=UPI00264873E8|nr:uncharacterized protein LOC131213163 [Anopheles bellator]
MDETSRNSAMLDIEGVRQQSDIDALRADNRAKESYKQIGEGDINRHQSAGLGSMTKNSDAYEKNNINMPRENAASAKEGEEERMLNGGGADSVASAVARCDEDTSEKGKLAQKDVEVKFISSKNGGVRIDLELENQQTFSGMAKEELMRYANDPFWVRLRWLLFVLFWALWVAMLLGSFYIIYDAPKCAAPVPLTWWQQGPLIEIDESQYQNQIEDIVRYGAKGVIYQLPADETYFIDSSPVKEKLEQLVTAFRSRKVEVIVDLTPNFVTKDDPLFREAIERPESDARNAFIWRDAAKAPNWLSIVEEGRAWKNISSGQAILSQFGTDRYDLQLNEPIAKSKLKFTIEHLISLGVRGVRLANAKHFIINRDGGDESPMNIEEADKSLSLTDYGFWTHKETTYREGLGELFHELAGVVHGLLHENGFISVTEDILRPEVFAVNGTLPIDIPLYGNIEFDLREGTGPNVTKKLRHDIENAYRTVKSYSAYGGGKPWLQLRYNRASMEHLGASEYTIFNFLLPGVPVLPLDVLTSNNVSQETIETLEKFRGSSSFQHGQFSMYNDANLTSLAYIRLKSGNPGYLVALNLAQEEPKVADFSGIDGIGSELTVVLSSHNYAVPNIVAKTKVPVNAIPLSPQSAIIATYVPTK